MKLANQALDRLITTFRELYPSEVRPSIPPGQLLLASLLQWFYGNLSERLLLEQLEYILLFRWFEGCSPIASLGVATTKIGNDLLIHSAGPVFDVA